MGPPSEHSLQWDKKTTLVNLESPVAAKIRCHKGYHHTVFGEVHVRHVAAFQRSSLDIEIK